MTLVALTVAALVLICGVCVYVARLLQQTTREAFQLVAAEIGLARDERSVLLDRVMAPYAVAARLQPDAVMDVGPMDADIDAEWAESDASLVPVPDDLMYMEDEEL